SQKEILNLLKKRGAKYRAFYISNVISVENPSRELLQELGKRSDILRIVQSAGIERSTTMPDDIYDAMNADAASDSESLLFSSSARRGDNLEDIGAKEVWRDFKNKGLGIVIATQDTGVDVTHPALRDQYRGTSEGKLSNDYNWHDSIREA